MSESSLLVAQRVDDPVDDARGSAAMLGLVIICSLAGWVIGIIAMIFVADPSVLLILAVVVFGSLATGAVLFGIRSFREGA
jgi:hypothetical protein